jgi:hypothetical protein
MRLVSELRDYDRDREHYLARRVAGALNDRDGSDLYAKCGQFEPEDAVLLSCSSRRARIPIQVVSTPGRPHIRYDNKNFRKFERSLKTRLQESGILSGHFLVSWTEDAVRRGLPPGIFKQLANEIKRRMPEEAGTLRLRSEDEYEQHPWITASVNWINGLCTPDLAELTISSPTSCYLPRDGTWITDAMSRKIKRYGNAGCKGMTLVVDGGHYVDHEQVASYLKAFNPAECPFDHLWIFAMGCLTQVK